MSLEKKTKNVNRNGACPICFDEDIELITLSKGCSCSTCSICMQTWLSTYFNRNNVNEASCPCCRRKISKEETISVLGEDIVAEMTAGTETEENPNNNNDNVDELTSDWLSTHGAKQCRHCGSWIIREEGCDAMICLCGHRFCWSCYDNHEDGECDCGYSHGDYFDNILRLEVSEFYDNRSDNSSIQTIETIEADTEDLDDLRTFMEWYRSSRREQYSIAYSTDEDSIDSTLVNNATSSDAVGSRSRQEESNSEPGVQTEVEPIAQNNNDTTFATEIASTTDHLPPGQGSL